MSYVLAHSAIPVLIISVCCEISSRVIVGPTTNDKTVRKVSLCNIVDNM